jgi:hypothetical protein
MTLAPHTPLSSPGKSAKRVFTQETGRPSTPRPIGSISGFPAHWIPAFAGMTGSGGGNDTFSNGTLI